MREVWYAVAEPACAMVRLRLYGSDRCGAVG